MNSFKDALDDYENRSDGGLEALQNDTNQLSGQQSNEDAPNEERIEIVNSGQNIGPDGQPIIDDVDSTLYMKDKKCRALVWMKIHEYNLKNNYGVNPSNFNMTSPQNNNTSNGQLVSFSAPVSAV